MMDNTDKPRLLDDPIVNEIAKKYNKDAGQVKFWSQFFTPLNLLYRSFCMLACIAGNYCCHCTGV